MSGWRFGRILGIDLQLHPSLVIIFVLIAANLALAALPAWHPHWGPGLSWAVAIAAAVLFLVSVLLHELGHAVVAKAFGMPVKSITLFLFGGIAQIEEEPPHAIAEFLMAIAGPLVSIALGVTFLVLGAVTVPRELVALGDAEAIARSLGPLSTLWFWLGPINLVVGIFNMLPGFPLDGGRVLRSALWGVLGDIQRATRIATRIGQGFGWGFVAMGVMMMFGVNVPVFGTGLVAGLWLAFIGWFLATAASQAYGQTVLHDVLGGVSVSRVMVEEVHTVGPDASVNDVVDNAIVRGDQLAVPVVEHGRLVGVLSIEDVRAVPKEAWSATRARDIMRPGDAAATATSGEPVLDVLKRLVKQDLEQMLVVENGIPRGLVGRREIARWLELHAPARRRA